MEVWMEKAGPWVELLLKGVAVTVELVRGKPRLVIRSILIKLLLIITVHKGNLWWCEISGH